MIRPTSLLIIIIFSACASTPGSRTPSSADTAFPLENCELYLLQADLAHSVQTKSFVEMRKDLETRLKTSIQNDPPQAPGSPLKQSQETKRLITELAALDQQYVDSHNSSEAPFKLTAMKRFYYGEDSRAQGPIRYFNEAERAQIRVTLVRRRLVDASGNIVNTGGRTSFVMDSNGQLYVIPLEMLNWDRVQHSSVLGGKPVAAAGEIQITNGQIVYIDYQSGHYRAAPSTTKQVLQALTAQDTKFHIESDVDHSIDGFF